MYLLEIYPADENFNFEIFYNLMKNQNFIIYPGKLTVADTFRIGCIGQIDNNIMRKVLSGKSYTFRNESKISYS